MEASLRLSDGCRQLRGDAVGDGESDRSWTVARKRRSAQTRTPAEGHPSLIRIAADPRSDRTRQRPAPTSVAVALIRSNVETVFVIGLAQFVVRPQRPARASARP